jgi:hypothetical protein
MNTDDKNMTTQDLIKRLRSIMPLGPLTEEIHKTAADRLEELQRESDEARAEVGRLKQKLHEARIENSGQAAQLERTRPDPSRLEIAAQLMAAHVYHLGMMYPEGLTLRQACFIEADALIAAAREGAK